jgi:hypothetical protein
MKKTILSIVAVVVVITLVASSTIKHKDSESSNVDAKQNVETQGYMVKQDKL